MTYGSGKFAMGMVVDRSGLRKTFALALGSRQFAWLMEGLDHSPDRWNVLAQQVLMDPVDRMPGSDVVVAVDNGRGMNTNASGSCDISAKESRSTP